MFSLSVPPQSHLWFLNLFFFYSEWGRGRDSVLLPPKKKKNTLLAVGVRYVIVTIIWLRIIQIVAITQSCSPGRDGKNNVIKIFFPIIDRKNINDRGS